MIVGDNAIAISKNPLSDRVIADTFNTLKWPKDLDDKYEPNLSKLPKDIREVKPVETM